MVIFQEEHVAHSKSAKKRNRQNSNRRMINKSNKTQLRSLIKQFDKAQEDNDNDTCKTVLPRAIKILDKSVSRGIVHKNMAARTKSRLTRKVNSFAAEK